MPDRTQFVRVVSGGLGQRPVRWCLALMAATGCSDPAGPDRALSAVAVERMSLMDLYDAAGGPNWTSNDNWLSDRPVGEWKGIHTDADGRVTAIRLEDNGLSGSIPGEVSRLRYLEELLLDGNDITGSIPSQFGSLSDLKVLSVADNRISGNIPSQIVRLGQLVVLNLDENQLGGGIPPQFGDLPNLQTLSARHNNLAGEDSLPAGPDAPPASDSVERQPVQRSGSRRVGRTRKPRRTPSRPQPVDGGIAGDVDWTPCAPPDVAAERWPVRSG